MFLFYRDIWHKARLWMGLSGHGGVGPRESVEGVDIETRFLPGGIKPSLLTLEFDFNYCYISFFTSALEDVTERALASEAPI